MNEETIRQAERAMDEVKGIFSHSLTCPDCLEQIMAGDDPSPILPRLCPEAKARIDQSRLACQGLPWDDLKGVIATKFLEAIAKTGGPR